MQPCAGWYETPSLSLLKGTTHLISPPPSKFPFSAQCQQNRRVGLFWSSWHGFKTGSTKLTFWGGSHLASWLAVMSFACLLTPCFLMGSGDLSINHRLAVSIGQQMSRPALVRVRDGDLRWGVRHWARSGRLPPKHRSACSGPT